MIYRRLGSTGLHLSALSFGSWITFGKQIDESTAEQLMHYAYEHGVNFFDNAEAYENGESERLMGNVLARSNWPRENWCVSSKVFWGAQKTPTSKGLSRKHIIEACHAALKRLQVDYLDLYFCHRPDAQAPISETVEAMSDLIRQGKVLYWGTSEWSAAEIMAARYEAAKHHLYEPVMEQPQYNMFARQRVEKEYRRIFDDYGMGTTIWSPMAGGKLSGKYLKEDSGPSRKDVMGKSWVRNQLEGETFKREAAVLKELQKMADELGITLARLSLAWCLSNPDVSTAILGASRVSQLEENLQAVDDLSLITPEIKSQIDRILAAHL